MADEELRTYNRCPFNPEVDFSRPITYKDEFNAIGGCESARKCPYHKPHGCDFYIGLAERTKEESEERNQTAQKQHLSRALDQDYLKKKPKILRRLVPKDHPDAGKPLVQW